MYPSNSLPTAIKMSVEPILFCLVRSNRGCETPSTLTSYPPFSCCLLEPHILRNSYVGHLAVTRIICQVRQNFTDVTRRNQRSTVVGSMVNRVRPTRSTLTRSTPTKSTPNRSTSHEINCNIIMGHT